MRSIPAQQIPAHDTLAAARQAVASAEPDVSEDYAQTKW
jgi:hypothetical protein